MLIKPNEPVFFELPDLESAIFLTEDQVDVSKVKAMAIADGFREQTERHITVIGGQAVLIKNTLEKMGEKKEKEHIKKMISLAAELDWQFTPRGVFKIAKEGCFGKDSEVIERRESYIREVDMPSMELFYEKLNNLLGLKLPSQFPHITLFTRGERQNPDWYGIPVPSKEEFERMNPIRISE